MTKDEKTRRALNILKILDQENIGKVAENLYLWNTSKLQNITDFKEKYLFNRMKDEKEWLYWHEAPAKYICVAITDNARIAKVASYLEEMSLMRLREEIMINRVVVWNNDTGTTCDITAMINFPLKMIELQKYIMGPLNDSDKTRAIIGLRTSMESLIDHSINEAVRSSTK
ncbi:MAG: hypothetical protein UT24_C0011G0033 [Candidatus Woesebacteria bacterium GW2011_GWB1_39_12]|uniref:Uncharacterized protein n=1 Tax=Candidatus Woesebacteria bacterium GW2011_GWB1_39_12 TaxID=1618574 RepID=A0A0G0PQZ9_9BACT|nr:MAG: hypothetical protein UT24_C0011G0033 [Candidatus Woesebacteria bacterium GW2011_GWB1_39_12]